MNTLIASLHLLHDLAGMDDQRQLYVIFPDGSKAVLEQITWGPGDTKLHARWAAHNDATSEKHYEIDVASAAWAQIVSHNEGEVIKSCWRQEVADYKAYREQFASAFELLEAECIGGSFTDEIIAKARAAKASNDDRDLLQHLSGLTRVSGCPVTLGEAQGIGRALLPLV